MSKRKSEPGMDSGAKKQQIVDPIPPLKPRRRFDYDGADDEERLITEQINGKLAILADQENYLTRKMPHTIKYDRQDYYISVECLLIHLPPLKMELLGLPPNEYAWSTVVGLFANLSVAGRHALLRSISEQVENRIVFIGPMHSAVLDMWTALEKMHPDPLVTSRLKLKKRLDFAVHLVYNQNQILSLSDDYVSFAQVATSTFKQFY